MRQLVLCSALLLAGCATYTRVSGAYRASLSSSDVESIVQLADTIWPRRHLTRVTLDAITPDRVGVYVLQDRGTTTWSSGYTAVRRRGVWTVAPRDRSAPTRGSVTL